MSENEGILQLTRFLYLGVDGTGKKNTAKILFFYFLMLMQISNLNFTVFFEIKKVPGKQW